MKYRKKPSIHVQDRNNMTKDLPGTTITLTQIKKDVCTLKLINNHKIKFKNILKKLKMLVFELCLSELVALKRAVVLLSRDGMIVDVSFVLTRL